MAIAFDRPPHESSEALRSALTANQLPEFVFADTHVEELPEHSVLPSTLMPHQVYAVRLDELASQNRLDLDSMAHPVSWRYILSVTPAAVTSADVNIEREEGRHRFSEFTKNGIAHRTVEQIKTSAKDQKILQREFRVRLLWIPALSFAALWLHRQGLDGSKHDVLVPLKGYSSVLSAGHYYTADELLAHLRPRAQWKKSMLPTGAS